MKELLDAKQPAREPATVWISIFQNEDKALNLMAFLAKAMDVHKELPDWEKQAAVEWFIARYRKTP